MSLPAVPRERRRTATVVAVAVLAALCLGGLVLGLHGLLAPADGRAPTATTPTVSTPATGSASAPVGGSAAPSTAASSTATPDPLAGAVGFSSPSGNIRCAISTTAARCDIEQKDWAAPARPAACRSGWGDGLQVTAQGSGIACADGRLAGGAALRYGRSITRGALRCTSDQDGVTCVHGSSGHAFTLARATFQVR